MTVASRLELIGVSTKIVLPGCYWASRPSSPYFETWVLMAGECDLRWTLQDCSEVWRVCVPTIAVLVHLLMTTTNLRGKRNKLDRSWRIMVVEQQWTSNNERINYLSLLSNLQTLLHQNQYHLSVLWTITVVSRIAFPVMIIIRVRKLATKARKQIHLSSDQWQEKHIQCHHASQDLVWNLTYLREKERK